MAELFPTPKVLIGLGNPDDKYTDTRHNIGFKLVDAVVTAFGGHWQKSSDKHIASFSINNHPVIALKPMTYMNNSGDVVSFLKMKGFKASDCLVMHDELEKPFGKISLKRGGSARGHNGLRSLIERWGTPDFDRLRFGIGRPDHKEQVPAYVLQRFEDLNAVDQHIQDAVSLVEKLYMQKEGA
jgi:peptidyl-tRNA hydrolase, PTH1 family